MTSHKINRQISNAVLMVYIVIILILFIHIGSLLAGRDGGIARSSSASPPYTFMQSWGTRGSLPSQFESPWGLAVSLDQLRVYVVDQGNNRIQWFDRGGEYISSVGAGGFGAGSFNAPFSVAASDSHFFVSDMTNNRIQDFDLDGHLIGLSGGFGNGRNDFHWPRGIEVTKYGTLVVVDSQNDRIKVVREDNVISMWGSPGTKDEQFEDIWDLDSDGDFVYVTDWMAGLVKQFMLDGSFVRAWGSGINGSARLLNPTGIAVDNTRQLVFVADSGHNTIRVYSLEGDELSTFGEYGDGSGQFDNPGGIDVAHDGTVYIADTGNHRIQAFSSAAKGDTQTPTATTTPTTYTPTIATSSVSHTSTPTPPDTIAAPTATPVSISLPFLARHLIVIDRTPTPTVCPVVETEENDDAQQAVNHPPLCEGVVIQGSMSDDLNSRHSDNNDFYHIIISECRRFDLQIDLFSIDRDHVDYDLYVIMPDGSKKSSPHPRSATEQIIVNCIPGRVFVRILRVDGRSNAPYALRWSFVR